VPVAVYPLTNLPSFDGPGARSDNATVLAAAGVQVIVVEGETGGPRDLRFAAGHAVRNGLAWDDALRAVTLNPATAFGVANRYGSLEPGKVANVVVWSGDPFEFSSRAEHVIIEGQEVPLTSRMTELLERYRHLPPSY
jgi:imidazolonepropionase-like amidohydrolase